jgi:hypothetical protein
MDDLDLDGSGNLGTASPDSTLPAAFLTGATGVNAGPDHTWASSCFGHGKIRGTETAGDPFQVS